MRGDSDFSPDVCVGQGVGVGKRGARGGGSPFIWAAHWCAEPAAGPAAPGGPASCRGAAGAPRLLRLPSRHRAGGAAGHGGVPLQKKYPPNAPKTPSPRDNNKKKGLLGGGAAGGALPAARYPGASLQRGEPPAGAAPPGPPGPGQPPGPAARKVCPAPSGRLAPQPAAAPWPPFGAVLSARRFGDRLSVAIKIKINSY